MKYTGYNAKMSIKHKLLFFILLVTNTIALAQSQLNQDFKLDVSRLNEPLLQQSRVERYDDFLNAPLVLLTDDEAILPTVGDSITTRAAGLVPGMQFAILRKQAAYVTPGSQQVLGIGAIYIGRAQVTGVSDLTTLKIMQSRDAVREGDRLFAWLPAATQPLTATQPSAILAGQIIGSLDGQTQIAAQAWVAVNVGTVGQVRPGDVLTIWRDRGKVRDEKTGKKIDAPDQKIGKLMIVQAFEQVSYAVVIQASQPVHLADIVKS